MYCSLVNCELLEFGSVGVPVVERRARLELGRARIREVHATVFAVHRFVDPDSELQWPDVQLDPQLGEVRLYTGANATSCGHALTTFRSISNSPTPASLSSAAALSRSNV